MDKKTRAKKIDEAIRIVWDSLDSHLDFTHSTSVPGKEAKGTSKFHQTCVKDYATIIKTLSELY